MYEVQLLKGEQFRTVWVEEDQQWYFSVVDVCGVPSGSSQSGKYWNDLKTKLKREGSELSEKIRQLKMKSSDDKYYKTDAKGFGENRDAARKGGQAAGAARRAFETESGEVFAKM